MTAYQVVIFTVLLSLTHSASHTEYSPHDLDRLREMFLANQEASTTTENPDNPMVNPDPRAAHTDFLVGKFDMASGTNCKSDDCRTLAKQLQNLIIDYNVKVIRNIGDNFLYKDFKYEFTPLHFKSIDIMVVTVYYRMLPPSGNGTTTTDRPRPTTRPTGPTDRTPDTTSPTTTRSTTITEASTTATTMSTSSTTMITSTTPIPESFSYFCSFEDDSNELCGAVQLSNDQFDWTRTTDGTDSNGTGPNAAYDGDYYFYIEASNPRKQNDRAKLALPANTGPAKHFCLRFKFHMMGQHPGTLFVRVQDSNSDANWRDIWYADGFSWPEWRDSAAFAFLPTGHRIIFEAVIGEGFEGDMAIDLVIVDDDITECNTK